MGILGIGSRRPPSGSAARQLPLPSGCLHGCGAMTGTYVGRIKGWRATRRTSGGSMTGMATSVNGRRIATTTARLTRLLTEAPGSIVPVRSVCCAAAPGTSTQGASAPLSFLSVVLPPAPIHAPGLSCTNHKGHLGGAINRKRALPGLPAVTILSQELSATSLAVSGRNEANGRHWACA